MHPPNLSLCKVLWRTYKYNRTVCALFTGQQHGGRFEAVNCFLGTNIVQFSPIYLLDFLCAFFLCGNDIPTTCWGLDIDLPFVHFTLSQRDEHNSTLKFPLSMSPHSFGNWINSKSKSKFLTDPVALLHFVNDKSKFWWPSPFACCVFAFMTMLITSWLLLATFVLQSCECSALFPTMHHL